MGTRIALVLGLAAFGLLFTGCGGNSSQAPVAQPTSPTYSMPNTGQDLESALAGLEALPLPDGVDATLWKDLKQAFATALESQQGKTGKFVSSPPTGEQNRVNDLRLVEGAGGSFTLEWSYVNVGDYDQNGEVNVADITPIAINYGATDSSPDWEAKAHFADGDNNNEVNVADITHIAINFQSTINEYQIQTGFTNDGTGSWDTVSSSQLQVTSGVLNYSLETGQVLPGKYYRVTPVSDGMEGEPSTPVFLSSEGQQLDYSFADRTRFLDPSSVSIVEVTDTSVRLSGDTPDLMPGDILISPEGRGLLRRVDSVASIGNDLVVSTSHASIDEAFDSLDFSTQSVLGAEQIESYEILAEGVELILDGSGHTPSKAPSASEEITLPKIILGVTVPTPVGNFIAEGDITFSLGLDVDLDFDTTHVEHFKFETWVQTDCNVSSTYQLSAPLMEPIRQDIVDIWYGAILVGPLVLLPRVTIGWELTVNGEIEISITRSFSNRVTAGIEYQDGLGWSDISDFEMWSEGGDPVWSSNAAVVARLGLVSAQSTLYIYGLAGPYVVLDIPAYWLTFDLTDNMVYLDVGVAVSIGAKISLPAFYWIDEIKLVDYRVSDLVYAKFRRGEWPLIPGNENEPPVAVLTSEAEIVQHWPYPPMLDASGSYDPDGDDLQFDWDLDGDGLWDILGSYHPFEYAGTWRSDGIYPVDISPRVRVLDGDWNSSNRKSSIATVHLLVLENKPPVAVLAADVYSSPVGVPVILDASASYDDEGDALEMYLDFDSDGVWDFILSEPWTHQVDFEVGLYHVTLLVKDEYHRQSDGDEAVMDSIDIEFY